MPRPTPPPVFRNGASFAPGPVDPLPVPPWPTEADLPNIQGIVLHAYGMRFAAHALLYVTDAKKARAFVSALVNPDSGLPQIQFATIWEKKPLTCVNIGFTYTGLAALGMDTGPNTGPFSQTGQDFAPFVRGSASPASAQQVGDVGPNDPSKWIFRDTGANGIEDHVVHVDLVVYGVCREDVLDQISVLRNAYLPAFREVVVLESQDVLPHGEIYWNIQDGISNPTLYPNNGTNAPPDGSALLPPESGPDFMVDPGWFVLDQAQMSLDGDLGAISAGSLLPLPTPVSAFKYGTFAALRRLQQHIDEPDGFNAWIDANWQQMQRAYQLGNETVSRAALKAVIVGRWPSGTALAHSPIVSGMTEAPPALPPDPTSGLDQLNNFIYNGDPGVLCPYTSHIRRADPRDGKVSSAVQLSRILRRAFPYQAPYVNGDQSINERGLFGFFISASLMQGFETVMGDWINGGAAGAVPAFPDSADPAMGFPRKPYPPPPPQPPPPQYTLTLTGTPTEPPPPFTPLTPFVTTRGSAYVFMPGLPGLTWIANGCPNSG